MDGAKMTLQDDSGKFLKSVFVMGASFQSDAGRLVVTVLTRGRSGSAEYPLKAQHPQSDGASLAWRSTSIATDYHYFFWHPLID